MLNPPQVSSADGRQETLGENNLRFLRKEWNRL